MHPILAELDPEQQQVATALGGPVMVLAGAGTGKTRAITHRIAYACLTGQRQARNGLAVTYTRRAAGEMRERLATLGVTNLTARTFHAAALSQLRYFWPVAVGGQFPEVLASKAKFVARAAGGLGLPTTTTMVRDLAAEVEWAGATMLLPAQYAAAALEAGRPELGSGSLTVPHAEVARVLVAYHDLKSRANVLDFEDILLTLIAVIGDRPDVSDQVRSAYQWFTVDEYQDITPVQECLLQAWLGERDDVCIVGDPNQTIYSFAGAAPDSMARFARRWPGALQVRLDRCYRCSPQVVGVANSVSQSGQLHGAGQAPQPHGWGLTLHSQRSPGPQPEVVTAADDEDEARIVTARIQALLAAGTPAREVAVLMRTNAASQPLEAALAQAGVPFVLRGGEHFFSRAEVREAIVRLRGAAAAAREGSADLAAATAEVLTAMGYDAAGPAGGSAQRERWESLAAVVELARQLQERAGPTLPSSAGTGPDSQPARGVGLADLVTELERRAERSLAPSADGVTLASLHSAKGLEWDHVFIIGLVEGNLPISYATTPSRIAEELRLLYVGITRARVGLVLTWALTWGSSARPRTPSRFLSLLRRQRVLTGLPAVQPPQAPAQVATRTGRKRRGRPGRCRVCGAGLVTGAEVTLGRCRTCPGAADPELLERLREWRAATAAARGVPAFVVFTDVTLSAIAERHPTDDQALLAIAGVGPAKLELYGADLLALLAAHA